MEGTNCETEAFQGFVRTGFDPKYVHVLELERGKTRLSEFDLIFIPGGFSAGDYVRAGAIFAARLIASAGKDMNMMDDAGKPVIGVCNGFQVLVEMGLLPGKSDRSEKTVALTFNSSNRFECRRAFVKLFSDNRMLKDAFSSRKSWEIPVAHSEGRLVFSDPSVYDELETNGQITFKYTDPEGNVSPYPWNPNGSYRNTAAISNQAGNVIGLMPHPERIYENYNTMNSGNDLTAGRAFFESIKKYSLSA